VLYLFEDIRLLTSGAPAQEQILELRKMAVDDRDARKKASVDLPSSEYLLIAAPGGLTIPARVNCAGEEDKKARAG
jgi:hypothetical protein